MEKQRKILGKSVKPVPEGFQTVTPFLILKGAEKFVEFAKKAFGAKVTFMNKMDNDLIMHCTVKIGDSTIMLADVMDGMEQQVAMLYLYVDDMDDLFQKALAANASQVREPRDEFYGDRAGAVKDEWGNTWWIATHVEDVSKDEIQRRQEALHEQESQ